MLVIWFDILKKERDSLLEFNSPLEKVIVIIMH